jgi:hypothetical protein
MSRPARDVLWIGAFFLLLLLLILVLRSRTTVEKTPPAITGTTSSPGVREETAPPEVPAAPPPVEKEPTPPVPAVTRGSPPPGSALVIINVTDVNGIEIKEPGLSIITPSGGLGFDSKDDRITRFRIYGAEAQIRILCGDLNTSHQLSPGDNLIQLPHGTEFGELAIKPAEWEKVQIRLKGGPGWRNPTGMDPEIGRRFLFLNPGEYEISDHKGFVAGTAVVVGGRRTTFTLTRLGAIKLDVSFTNESKEKRAPVMLPVEIRGVTPNASHPNGYRISLMTRNNQRTYVESGLNPGTYQVTSEQLQPRYQETFVIQGGEVRIAKFTHTID